MFCPNCGKDCADSRFCPDCGQPLRTKTAEQTFEEKRKELQQSGVMYCPNCLSTNYVITRKTRIRRSYGRNNSWLSLLIDIMGYSAVIGYRQAFGDSCQCVQCGTQWNSGMLAITERYHQYIAPILGQYTEVHFPAPDGGYLQLSAEGILIFDAKMRSRAILLEQIVDVQYRNNFGACYGWLSIRHVGNRRKPFPKEFKEAKKDKTTVFLDFRYADAYFELYNALKAIAEENKKVGL